MKHYCKLILFLWFSLLLFSFSCGQGGNSAFFEQAAPSAFKAEELVITPLPLPPPAVAVEALPARTLAANSLRDSQAHSLSTGWSTVSFPFNALSALSGVNYYLYSWNGTQYEAVNPASPAGIDCSKSYWAYCDAPASVSATGTYSGSLKSAALHQGWNFFLFPRRYSRKFSKLTLTYQGETKTLSQATSYQTTAGSAWAYARIYYYRNAGWSQLKCDNGENTLQPWYGYWIWSWQDGVTLNYGKEWTLMVYLDGDNNLETYGKTDLDEMKSVGSTPEIDVIVLWDGYDGASGRPAGSKIYYVKNNELQELADWGEKNMGDPQTLTDFLNYATGQCPAKDYFLVLWNHGRGWTRSSQGNQPRNFSYDWSSNGDSLSFPELKSALEAAAANLPNRIDIVAFDACLMGMLEAAYCLKDAARVLAASEETTPADGFLYDDLLNYLTANPTVDRLTLAAYLVDDFIDAYTGTGSSVTMSALNLEQISGLITCLNDFALKLQTSNPTQNDLGAVAYATRYYSYQDYLDLRNFAELIKNDAGISNVELKNSATNLYNALAQGSSNFVIKSRYYSDPDDTEVDNSHGVSVYLPSSKWYSGYNSEYGSLNFAQDTLWDDFLVYHQANYSPPASNFTFFKSWGGVKAELGYSLAVDSGGNLYVAGYTDSFGAGNSEVFLLKYNSSGSLLWQRCWGGSNNEKSYGIAVDSSGIYLTGYTNSFGVGNADVFLIKYDTSGSMLWQKTWGRSGYDEAGYKIALDPSGNLYLAGYTEYLSTGNRNVLLLKYSSEGARIFSRSWGGSNDEVSYSIAVDSAGDLYLTGYTQSFGAGNADVFLLKYNSAGDLLFRKTWGGAADELANAIAATGAVGSIAVYVTGYTQSFGAGNAEVFLLKYNSSGNIVWQKTWGGANDEKAYGLTLDSGGNPYLTGYTATFGSLVYKTFLLKYDSAGSLLAQKLLAGGSDLFGLDLIITGGQLYLAGFTSNTMSNYWPVSATDGISEGSVSTPTTSGQTPAGTDGTPTGTQTTPTGSETYAGDADSLLLKMAP